MSRLDLLGQVFGRLTVRELVSGPPYTWLCVCVCGNEKTTTTTRLRAGKVQSCGCLRKETGAASGRSKRSHGHTSGKKRSRTWISWKSMKSRCYSPGATAWPNYGAKGVRVCKRWFHSFEAFLEDMGERPDGMTLDRIDPTGHYTPKNCRWATPLQQTHNRRKKA